MLFTWIIERLFDSVPHRRLIEKLRSIGINGNLLEWLNSFLTSRTMRVCLRGTFSELMEVLSGVPQGSMLPLLFLLYVNELPECIKCDMIMFADDTKLWCKITKDEDRCILQDDLDKLKTWSNVHLAVEV